MIDDGGLQIDIRCIRCGKLPTANAPLYEMQNHLYICQTCYIAAEQQGKHISLVNGAQMEIPGTPVPTSSLASEPTNRLSASNLPPDSMFVVLGLPLNAVTADIEAALNQKMRTVLREPDSQRKTVIIEKLHEWHALVENPEELEKYRNSLRPNRQEGAALSVGGRLVYTAEEFLNACEASEEGWSDGERYLRRGQLQHWIMFHLGDRDMAAEARRYQKWTEVSNFRALNEMLYCFVPQRPFRLYEDDCWQPLNSVPTAANPQELARQCDLRWIVGERHLYEGSMVYWLEHSQRVQQLNDYYTAAIAQYAFLFGRVNRGVGLELILERAFPSLPHPRLVVTFDGIENQYSIKKWDREIEHKPVQFTITNTTRGFVALDVFLEPPKESTEPVWISLDTEVSSPWTYSNYKLHHDFSKEHFTGRPLAGFPAQGTIYFPNLPFLKRGHTYQCNLNMEMLGEHYIPSMKQAFPITLKTMYFFQGLRGILWRYGLRGGLVGFFWNFIAAWLPAFLLLLIFPAIVPASFGQYSATSITFGDVSQQFVFGTASTLRFLGMNFPLIVGFIIGFAGLWVGIGKGHKNSQARHNAGTFRWWSFWLILPCFITLLILDGGFSMIWQAMQNGSDYTYGPYFINMAVALAGGGFIVTVLVFTLACIISSIRRRLEEMLRVRYTELLNPSGRAYDFS